MTYKEIKAKYNLTDAHIAEWFGYTTANTFRNSSKFKQVKSGIEHLYTRFLSEKEVKKEGFKEIINREIEKL